MSKRLTVIVAPLVVGAGIILGATAAMADTVDFTDNGTFSTQSLTEGIVTVTGSDAVSVRAGRGLGVLGGSPLLEAGETLSFSFDNVVDNVLIGDYIAADLDGDGTDLDATIEAFDVNGTSLGSVTTMIDPAFPIDVSGILAVSDLFKFDITISHDGIFVGSVSFQEVSGAESFSCAGFASPFHEPLTISKKTKKTIPAKIILEDADAYVITDTDIVAPPVITVEFNGVIFGDDTVDDNQLEPVGNSNQGNGFSYNPDMQQWEYRIGTKQFSEPGTYTVAVRSGDETEYTINATGGNCTNTFTRQN